MPWGLLPAQEEVHPPSCGEAGGYQERLSGEGDPWGPGSWGPSHEKGQDEQVREVTNSMMSGEFYLQLISLEWKVRSSVWEGLGWRHLKTGLGFMLAPKRGSWNVHWMFSKSWHDEIMFLNIAWKSATYLILSAFVGFLFWFGFFWQSGMWDLISSTRDRTCSSQAIYLKRHKIIRWTDGWIKGRIDGKRTW